MPEGLRLYDAAVDASTESDLVDWIDSQPWITELSRRVQHYGWRYDYRSRQVSAAAFLGPLPSPLALLADGFFESGLLTELPDQAIINEYLPGQGIAQHIDCKPCFGDEIATLSLLDSYPMDFDRPANPDSHTVWLARRSLCLITGDSRWAWRHGIAKRISDPGVGSVRKARRRRISVTFRRVVGLGDA